MARDQNYTPGGRTVVQMPVPTRVRLVMVPVIFGLLVATVACGGGSTSTPSTPTAPSASCSFLVTGSPFTLNATNDQSQRVGVQPSAATCMWTATSNSSFIVLGAISSGGVDFTVERNTGAERVGTLTVAGQTVTVTQGAGVVPCTFQVNRPLIIRDALSTFPQTVAVTKSAPTCQWTPVASGSFINIDSFNDTQFVFSNSVNTSQERRTGTIAVGSAVVNVIQTEAVGFPTPPANALSLIGAVPVSGAGPFAGPLSDNRVGLVVTMRYELATEESAYVCAMAQFNPGDGNPLGTCLPQLIYKGTGAKAVVIAVNEDATLPLTTMTLRLVMARTAQLTQPFMASTYADSTFRWFRR